MVTAPLLIEVLKLREEIVKHNYSYYVLNNPDISDRDYNVLFQRLQKIEEDYPQFKNPTSPTQTVGFTPNETLGVMPHSVPMLSLRTETDYSDQGAHTFDGRMRALLKLKPKDPPIEYCAELKYDGLAVSLKYVDGKLTLALTRGNGEEGEIVTSNVSMINDTPPCLKGIYPPLVEVRGEVYMTLDSFRVNNILLKDNGFQPYKNPRNAASGRLRSKNPKVTGQLPLNFFPYSLHQCDEWEAFPQTQFEVLKLIQSWGFPMNEHVRVVKGPEWLVLYRDIVDKRKHLNYEFDGVVYKLNSLTLQKQLGYNGREPIWALAHKFDPALAESKILAIRVGVGATGNITPVAEIIPVNLGGTTISYVNLYNQAMINKKDIRLGDTVLVQRAGDVIPEIHSVDRSCRDENVQPYSLIKEYPYCPSCGAPITIKPSAVIYRCEAGDACPDQLIGKIETFAKVKETQIKGLGRSTARLLVKTGLVKSLDDLLTLNFENLKNICGIQGKKAISLITQIEKFKSNHSFTTTNF